MRRGAAAVAVAVAALVFYAPAAAADPLPYTCRAKCALPRCHCPQQVAPGGLAPEDVPQFILVTHDDATDAAAVAAIASITAPHRNAGAACDRPIPATFFTSGLETNCSAVKAAWAAGHEIAAHTWSHLQLDKWYRKWTPEGRTLEEEIVDVRTWLVDKCGVPRKDVVGHRSPFLVQAPNTREVLHDAGFLYDSTINEHWPTPTSPGPGQRLWPYTWDSGTPQDCAHMAEAQVCVAGESYPGLWEVPLWMLQADVPEAQYPKGSYLMDPGGDVFALLKTNFDWSYAGNRAPLPIAIHRPWITPANAAATNRFLEYALAKRGVFAVTMHQLLQWMADPVPVAEFAAWLGCAPGGRAEAKHAPPPAPGPPPAPPAPPAAEPEPEPEPTVVAAVSEAAAPAPADEASSLPMGVVVIAGAAVGAGAAALAGVAAAAVAARRHAAAAAAAAAEPPAGGDPESPGKPSAPSSRGVARIHVDARASPAPRWASPLPGTPPRLSPLLGTPHTASPLLGTPPTASPLPGTPPTASPLPGTPS